MTPRPDVNALLNDAQHYWVRVRPMFTHIWAHGTMDVSNYNYLLAMNGTYKSKSNETAKNVGDLRQWRDDRSSNPTTNRTMQQARKGCETRDDRSPLQIHGKNSNYHQENQGETYKS